MPILQWKEGGPYFQVSEDGQFKLCTVYIQGEPLYGLSTSSEYIGTYPNQQEAKAAAEQRIKGKEGETAERG